MRKKYTVELSFYACRTLTAKEQLELVQNVTLQVEEPITRGGRGDLGSIDAAYSTDTVKCGISSTITYLDGCDEGGR